jgi:hypothetical protein
MSVRASSWAWESSRSTGSSFLVLLALADHAGADGGDCYPSVARLAARCRVDERTVQRAIDKLIELGEVVIEEEGGRANPGGRGRSNRYKLTFRGRPQDGEKPVEEPRQSATLSAPETPASAPGKGGTTPPEPSVEPTTPLPPASGGSESAPEEHRGQHPSCRACGTNRRGAKPPNPELVEAEARRRRLAQGNEQVRSALTAPDVLDADTNRARAAEVRAALRGGDETGST